MAIALDEITRRHLLTLWASIRDAIEVVSAPEGREVLGRDLFRPLARVVGADARQLADALERVVDEREHASDGAVVQRSRPRVLVVDDDSASLNGMSALLTSNFEVVTAADAEQAIRILREESIDAVIADICMPRLDGLALLRMFREDALLQLVPCILVTGVGGQQTRLRAMEAGAADFLYKPVDAAELVVRLDTALERARQLRRERQLQETDDLTGLLNRRGMRTVLSAEVRRARAQRTPLSVALLDQDGLKQLNDTWGHDAGDAAIVAVGQALARNRRAGDAAVRLGGDEFALLMPGATAASAELVVARVRRDLEERPLALGGVQVTLKVSCGIASFDATTDAGWETMLRRADEELYAAKRRAKRTEGHRSAAPPDAGPPNAICEQAPGEYRVPRRMLEREIVAESVRALLDVRERPAFEPRAGLGLSVTSVRPGSLLERLGFHSGDLVRQVNGIALGNLPQAHGFLGRLGDEAQLEVELERSGRPVHLTVVLTGD